LGRGQLVGIGRRARAHAARRRLPGRANGAAFSRLRLFLDRHAARDGARVPGLWLPLRDAPGHEPLEHTYLALYPPAGAQRGVEHLVPGMAVLDKSQGSTLLPRFLGFADDRDFFYLTARKDPP